MAGWKPPEFNEDEFCAVLERLGFKLKRNARHGRLYYHPNRKGTAIRPFITVPKLRGNREFQKALFRDLYKYWDFDLTEIKKAFK